MHTYNCLFFLYSLLTTITLRILCSTLNCWKCRAFIVQTCKGFTCNILIQGSVFSSYLIQECRKLYGYFRYCDTCLVNKELFITLHLHVIDKTRAISLLQYLFYSLQLGGSIYSIENEFIYSSITSIFHGSVKIFIRIV